MLGLLVSAFREDHLSGLKGDAFWAHYAKPDILRVPAAYIDKICDKMGKTAGGTKVWLDADKTSPYAFYQYWLNVEDADVSKLLRMFSFRSLEEIGEIDKAHAETPHKRAAQKTLAEDVTTFVHGAEALRRAIAASQVMFGGSLEEISTLKQ